MADARSYTEKRYRFCDNRIRKKITETQIILNHLNNGIFFNLEKKNSILSGPTVSESEKNEFQDVDLFPSGQLQQDPMADARSYTEKRYRFCDNPIRKKITETQIILNHLNNNIFEFRKKNSILSGPTMSKSEKKSFRM